MKPRNFPAKVAARQIRAVERNKGTWMNKDEFDLMIQQARSIRTKKVRKAYGIGT